ncbi:MAG: hypothetical protein M1820_003397 [Bogoriella megaspora]|nr:MAG: hypothetical protein M1820_003397 [Bogoriella megaspora]
MPTTAISMPPDEPQSSRISLESTRTLLASQQRESPSTSSPGNPTRQQQPPSYDSHQDHHPRVRDFSDAASIAPSTTSTLPVYQPNTRYPLADPRARLTETEYLQALQEFANEKKYMQPTKDLKGREVGLVGFYGEKTMEEIAGPRKERKKSEGGSRKGSFIGLGLRDKMRRKSSAVGTGVEGESR